MESHAAVGWNCELNHKGFMALFGTELVGIADSGLLDVSYNALTTPQRATDAR
jgi:hypothetical protein